MYIYIYKHTIHAYIHTYIQKAITFSLASILTDIPYIPYIHTYIQKAITFSPKSGRHTIHTIHTRIPAKGKNILWSRIPYIPCIHTYIKKAITTYRTYTHTLRRQ